MISVKKKWRKKKEYSENEKNIAEIRICAYDRCRVRRERSGNLTWSDDLHGRETEKKKYSSSKVSA
jgi:hypothetical protein